MLKESVMNKFMAAIRRAPKRAAGLAMIAAAVLVPAALFAWGPDRPTFTYGSPAPYVTFNSITNNPQVGDERNFVRIKEAGTTQNFSDNATLVPGKKYEVYVYFHNNAASNLNDAAHDYKGIAKDVALQIKTPAVVNANTSANIRGVISSSNANPGTVWDEAVVTSASTVALRYVNDSAVIHSNGAVNGQKLPDTLFGAGTALGYDALNGKLPGCNQFAGYVTYEFAVDQPNFEVAKTVSKDGENKYSESVTTVADGKVQYKIQYKNTGTTRQDGVVIKDTLPAGMKYVAGSTLISTSKSGGQYVAAPDGVTAGGLEIGSYAPGGNAYIKFTAQVVSNDKLEKCGVNTLINKATAQTQNGNKSDTANVVVSRECKPNECKPGIPMGDKRCEENCTIPGKEHLPKDSPECVTTVTELPETGMTENVLGVLGLGAFAAAIAYAVTSRRASAQN